jgi:hypothetical protein
LSWVVKTSSQGANIFALAASFQSEKEKRENKIASFVMQKGQAGWLSTFQTQGDYLFFFFCSMLILVMLFPAEVDVAYLLNNSSPSISTDQRFDELTTDFKLTFCKFSLS